MSSLRSRSGGSCTGMHVQAVEQILAELSVGDHACQVAVGRGDDRARPPSSCASRPTRSNSRSCSTRSSFICSAALIVPTSSRNSVPLCACSSRPCRLPTAPVNAPRTWPNSSASSSVSGMALQFSATNRCMRRGLLW